MTASVYAVGVPEILRYHEGCLCDARKFACNQVIVIVKNRLESASVTCRLQSSDKLSIACTRLKLVSALFQLHHWFN